jgi:hypothetical protein
VSHVKDKVVGAPLPVANRAPAASLFLAETAVLPAMKSVSRRRPACLPIVHIYCAVVVGRFGCFISDVS